MNTVAAPKVDPGRGRVVVVVGMQYGSEGKGHIAYLLASLTQVAIRTGAPNAWT